MTHAKISACLPPDIDPTKAALAYGDRAIPKLNEELNDINLLIRQRALMALCDVMHNPENISQAIRWSVLRSLRLLLKDKDEVVRMKTSEVLLVMSGHAIGREGMLAEKVIQPLAGLFDDPCYSVRKNAHEAVFMCTAPVPGPEGVVACNLIPILIKKLHGEASDIKKLILDTLHHCIRIAADQALESRAMPILAALLRDSDSSIRSKAARNIMELCFPLAGKEEACDVGSVPVLCQLLKDEDAEVKAHAAAALMAISITTRGKKCCLEADAIPSLIENLLHSCSQVRLNSLKAITTLSEAPTGRQKLLISLPMIQALEKDAESAAVRKAALLATKSITWKP